jgi:hypothetical protein
MPFDKEKFETLLAKEINDHKSLTINERVYLNKHREQFKKGSASNAKPLNKLINGFGTINANKKEAKLVRFVSSERKALRIRKDELLANSPQDVLYSLGTLNAVSEDLMVRAAVHHLNAMSDEKIISLMKEVQMNAV